MTTDTMAPPLRTELAAACGAARAGGRAMRFYGSARVVEKEGGSLIAAMALVVTRVLSPWRRARRWTWTCWW